MAKNGQNDAPGTDVVLFNQATVTKFAEMAAGIPEDDGMATDRIVTQILESDSWEDLSAPWDTTKAAKLVGKLLRVNALKRQPSTYEGGLGIFLVVSSTDTATGEELIWATGSNSIVAQLVTAYHRGWLPLLVEFVISERPSQRGFHPQHLRFVGKA